MTEEKRVIEAQEFRLVDKDGNTRGSLSVSDHGPRLELYNKHAKNLITLCIADSPLILSFPSSHQYDFLILRGDQAVWRWSHERLFAQALTQLALMPHETRAIRARWDQKDPDGNQVPFGAYKALGQILAKEKTYTATTSLSIVRPPPEDQAK